MRPSISSFAFLLVAAPLTSLAAQGGYAAAPAASAQTAMASAAPAVGSMAPDFTALIVDTSGAKKTPFSLSKARGKVVVLAFYPADFSSGCTIEMTKFRDDYKTIFGDGVIVLPTSKDSIGLHKNWEVSMKFPFDLMVDTAGVVAKQYASYTGARYFSRTIYVIGKDGKVAYTDPKFNVNSADAYGNLAAAVKAAKDAR